MELLLILQPLGMAAFGLSLAAVIVGALALFIGTLEREKRIARGAKKVIVAGIIGVCLFATPANAWMVFKNVVTYRAVTSETAEKAVDVLDTLLNRIETKIGEM